MTKTDFAKKKKLCSKVQLAGSLADGKGLSSYHQKTTGVFKWALSDLKDLIDSKRSQVPSSLPGKPLQMFPSGLVVAQISQWPVNCLTVTFKESIKNMIFW